jgi:membrane associated rhomboid family serine protease
LVAGTYVERKIGTVNILVLVASFAFFCGCAVAANHSGTSVGFSGVNYAFYAYIIIDYVFMFIDKKQTKANTIYGAIVLALIYLATCFCGGTSSFSFKIYPYDLLNNMGHYTSFLTGAILTLLLQFVKWQTAKSKEQ